MRREQQEPLYSISVACRLLGCHPQTLRLYERLNLIKPQRQRNRRLYSNADLERARRIQHLTRDMGVNLAGVEIILRLLKMIDEINARFEAERERLRRLIEQQHLSARMENPPTLIDFPPERRNAFHEDGRE
ncbi:MAG: MerR family transcriptional regulator [Abditibacteriales bacterium]|nr:MerR family transcriptional regulator [Abditibacteriales bacterium]MDW8365532.1 MerR family transcriptional regulator [Abditibacteriales bacterium]